MRRDRCACERLVLAGVIGAMLALGCGESDKGGPASVQQSDSTNPGESWSHTQDDVNSYSPAEDCYASISDSLSAYDSSYYVPEPEGPGQTGELYGVYIENEFIETTTEPTSTFSVDVDTGSYTIMRRDVTGGSLPDPDSVRVEEYINYFRYDYPQPDEHPFSVNMEVAPSPFGEGLHLLRIGLMGRIVPEEERLAANLVFLVDVSGSMQASNKLPLVKFMLKNLVTALRADDRLGIIVYSGHESILLESTAIEDKSAILEAINSLNASGSTAGANGLAAAYKMFDDNIIPGGINRVILCTDGDFNVGITGEALIEMIENYRDTGITLSVFAFGTGNLNDQYMEQLADHGNGNYAYIDTQEEALNIINKKLVAILQVIAKDVKVQVEFNPANVLRYRLVGYENRLLQNEDFENDKVDAAEIGAGHTVTAFYEVELAATLTSEQLSECRLRYKLPEGVDSILITQTVLPEAVLPTFEEASASLRFAAAVVEFAEILRQSKHSEGAQFGLVASIVAESMDTANPEAVEFSTLVGKASELWPE